MALWYYSMVRGSDWSASVGLLPDSDPESVSLSNRVPNLHSHFCSILASVDSLPCMQYEPPSRLPTMHPTLVLSVHTNSIRIFQGEYFIQRHFNRLHRCFPEGIPYSSSPFHFSFSRPVLRRLLPSWSRVLAAEFDLVSAPVRLSFSVLEDEAFVASPVLLAGTIARWVHNKCLPTS